MQFLHFAITDDVRPVPVEINYTAGFRNVLG